MIENEAALVEQWRFMLDIEKGKFVLDIPGFGMLELEALRKQWDGEVSI